MAVKELTISLVEFEKAQEAELILSPPDEADPSNTENLFKSFSESIEKAILRSQKQITRELLKSLKEYEKLNAQIEKKESEIVELKNPFRGLRTKLNDVKESFQSKRNDLWISAKRFVNQAFKRGSDATKREFKVAREPEQPDNTSKDKELKNSVVDNVRTITQQLIEDQSKKIRELTNEALTSGISIGEIKKRIDEILSKTRKKAKLVARTEMTRAAAAAKKAKYDSAGIKEWIWFTNLDGRQCPICNDLHMSRIKVGEVFGTNQSGNAVTMPPAHPNCRCTVIMVKPKRKEESEK